MPKRPTHKQIRELAEESPMLEEGVLELDDKAKVSMTDGDDLRDANGAYVQTWMWVDFSETDLDQDEE